MNKPITMQIKEFKEKIVQDINMSNLPPFVLESMFRDLYNEIHILAIKQEKKEQLEYEQFLEEQNKDKEKKESAEK